MWLSTKCNDRKRPEVPDTGNRNNLSYQKQKYLTLHSLFQIYYFDFIVAIVVKCRGTT